MGNTFRLWARRPSCAGALRGPDTHSPDDLAMDPERIGSRAQPKLGEGRSGLPPRHSRTRARARSGTVHASRHVVAYRHVTGDIVGIGRILHDAMDLDVAPRGRNQPLCRQDLVPPSQREESAEDFIRVVREPGEMVAARATAPGEPVLDRALVGACPGRGRFHGRVRRAELAPQSSSNDRSRSAVQPKTLPPNTSGAMAMPDLPSSRCFMISRTPIEESGGRLAQYRPRYPMRMIGLIVPPFSLSCAASLISSKG